VSARQHLLRACLAAHYDRASGGSTELDDVRAVTLVRDLEPVAFIQDALRFALGLPGELSAPWLRSFTRTLFFAGNPASLAGRLAYRHVADDGAVAWLGPAAPDATRTVSRALRLFQGPGVWPGALPPIGIRVPATAPAAAAPVTAVPVTAAPAAGTSVELRIACGGVSAAEYLVHLHHVLCEAALRGLVRPGDLMDVAHVPGLDIDDVDVADVIHAGGAGTHVRIAQDPAGGGDLRLYAHLRRTP